MSDKFATIVLITALLGGVTVNGPANAVNLSPIKMGTIQSVNILKHTLTVNGRTYKVSSKATYVGSLGLSVLSAGIKIRYYLGRAKAGQSRSIVRIIVIPG